MAVRERKGTYYVAFRWNNHRMDTATSATSMVQARKIEKAVRKAFSIGRFDHLDPDALDVVVRTFKNKGWALPPEISGFEPEKEITLASAIVDYFGYETYKTRRNWFASNHLRKYFGDDTPLKQIRGAHVEEYRLERQNVVENGTVNREMAVLSGIFSIQKKLENLDYNPCLGIKRLPENQRDTYLAWDDFNRLLENSWWLREVITVGYYTGMRFSEIANLRWEMFKPERKVVIIPAKETKEGKSKNKTKLHNKRIPLRQEVVDIFETIRKRLLEDNILPVGRIFSYSGRYKDHCGTHPGKPLNSQMIRKVWSIAIAKSGLEGLQMRDLRHTWKTNALHSEMDPSVRNGIMGHSGSKTVEDRYIHLSDKVILDAVNAMTFDHGCTQINVVEEVETEGSYEKTDVTVTSKSSQNKNQGEVAKRNTLISEANNW